MSIRSNNSASDASSSLDRESRSSEHAAPVIGDGTIFYTTDAAARRLQLDADSLRARCRRAARHVGDSAIAHLGGGIVAFKFGQRWRVRFPTA